MSGQWTTVRQLGWKANSEIHILGGSQGGSWPCRSRSKVKPLTLLVAVCFTSSSSDFFLKCLLAHGLQVGYNFKRLYFIRTKSCLILLIVISKSSRITQAVSTIKHRNIFLMCRKCRNKIRPQRNITKHHSSGML